MTKLLINEHPLMVLPSLATKIGLNESIIIQQIHYWLDPRINNNIKNGRHWVYNTYKEWNKQFPFWSEVTIKRTIRSLEKDGLLISTYEDKFSKLKWYTINYENLESLETTVPLLKPRISKSDQCDPVDRSNRSDRQIKMTRRYINDTETTTETTNTLSFDNKFKSSKKTKQSGGERLKEYSDSSLEKEMLGIWKKFVEEGRGEGSQKLELTETRKRYLSAALSKHFMKNIDQWSAFCEMIASSKFLMGDITSFKATLDWVLKDTNLQKIIQGNYKTGDRELFLRGGEQSKSEILEEINNEPGPSEWKKFKLKILHELGEGAYRSWFSKLMFVGYQNEKVSLKASTAFIRQWIEEKYPDILKSLLEKSFKDVESYEVIV
jgi:DNA-binding PadR family transcriptional regulator